MFTLPLSSVIATELIPSIRVVDGLTRGGGNRHATVKVWRSAACRP
jgi:hypothetical protein